MEKKTKTKSGNKIKILTIVLAMILISMIGFIGIYTRKQNRMQNIVEGYDLAMDLKGARVVSIAPTEDKETVIKDAEGNKIDEDLTDEEIKEKGYTKEEIDNNADKKTKENFENAKNIIEKRLKDLGVDNSIIKLNEETGEITLEIEENTNTDQIVSEIPVEGKFEIVDSKSNEVLMDNSSIKEVNVVYGTETNGTMVYLQIIFTDEGKTKLEEITNTYATQENKTTEENTTDENTTNETTEENTTEEEQKEIILKIDDQDVMTTSFDQPIKTGKLELSVGTSSTDSDKIQTYVKKAKSIATELNNGKLPMQYDVTGNEYIISDIETDLIQKISIGIIAVIAILAICIIIKYKLNGFISIFTTSGFIALFLILIRYANVKISLEGIFAIAIIVIINYLLVWKLLENSKGEEIAEKMQKTYANFILRIMPISIMAITFCFINWIPISSFGMVMFWGIVLLLIYNWIITVPVLKMRGNKEEKTEK